MTIPGHARRTLVAVYEILVSARNSVLARVTVDIDFRDVSAEGGSVEPTHALATPQAGNVTRIFVATVALPSTLMTWVSLRSS